MGVEVFFVDDYVPDEHAIASASKALRSGDEVIVNWPPRTVGLIELKVPDGISSQVDSSRTDNRRDGDWLTATYAEVMRLARSRDRLPVLSRLLDKVGASSDDRSQSISNYLRFANLSIIGQLYPTLLESEGGLLEKVHSPRLYMIAARYNTPPLLAALGVNEPIHSVNVHAPGIEPSLDVYAPASLVKAEKYGVPLGAQLLVEWAFPQFVLPKPPQFDAWEGISDADVEGFKMQGRRDENGDEYI